MKAKLSTIVLILTVFFAVSGIGYGHGYHPPPVDPPPYNPPPTVSITSPANNAEFIKGDAVPITAVASDTAPGYVTKVEFRVNGSLLPNGTDYSAPYECTWNTADFQEGNYTLRATAYDNGGASASSSVVVKLFETPHVSLTLPIEGDVFITNEDDNDVYIKAITSDTAPDYVTSVEFYANGTLLYVDSDGAPYEYTWSNAPPGEYNLTAKAYDNDGKSTTSAPVKIACCPRGVTYDVHDSYQLRQAQENAANYGDIIVLHPGPGVFPGEGVYTGYFANYHEWHCPIEPRGKSITYKSVDPNDPNCVTNTIIYGANGRQISGCEECEYDDRWPGAYFAPHANGRNWNSKMRGLTFTCGFIHDVSGGVVPTRALLGCSPYPFTALAIVNTSPKIRQCRFVGGTFDRNDPDNDVTFCDGCLCDLAKMEYCTCREWDDGGIYAENSRALIEDCNISIGRIGYWGIALPVQIGGDWYETAGNSDITIRDCNISDNNVHPYFAQPLSDARPFVHTIKLIDEGKLNIENCKISENCGIGIYAEGGSSDINMTNCVISGNERRGINLAWGSKNVTIRNCTISDNVATDYGGGLYSCIGPAGHVDITNSIFWGNSPLQQLVTGGSDVNISHCDIQHSKSVGYAWPESTTIQYIVDVNFDLDPQNPDTDCILGKNLGGNKSADPNFIAIGDYHIGPSSPCKNAGDNSVVTWPFDLDGDARIINWIVDIGADERPLE
jgi:parallel beta-helix repeat protein